MLTIKLMADHAPLTKDTVEGAGITRSNKNTVCPVQINEVSFVNVKEGAYKRKLTIRNTNIPF